MKNKLSLCLLALSFSTSVYAGNIVDKVIYGQDDRLDVYEATNTLHKELAASTAAMIPSSSLQFQTADDTYLVKGSSLQSGGICATARFAKQITAANCSGFLVGEQYLVTAGHCIETMSDCNNYSWAFGYSNDTEEKISHVLSKQDVYTCSTIVSRSLDRMTQDDFALIKLDRPVTGRDPLKFRTSGKIADRSDIVVIGHPSGLPTKIASGASVRTNTNNYFFQATLDTFGGNSGSAVFDTVTGLVEGILVRGERDYVYQGGCMVPKVCLETECRGEDVTRITNIKALMKMASGL
jgi:V8-like Glu-specific endopeptidase